MLFLTAAGTAQGDPVALVMVLALAVVVGVMALRKLRLRKQAASAAPAAPVAPAPEAPKSTAPGSAGKLKLHDVEPKTAAMLMAITADSLGKPLNELRFISVKEVKK